MSRVPDILALAAITREEAQRDVMYWGGLLILVILVGAAGILLVRRWMRGGDSGGQPDAGFSLSDLRAMRDRGEITSEEYEQTRARVIAKVKGRQNSTDEPER